MVAKELSLKGSLHGTTIIKEYQNPDILYSIVDNKICKGNSLKIKYNKEKNNFYVYHSFDRYNNELKKTYSGRWYNTNTNFDYKSINENKKTLTVILKNIEWENFDTGKYSIKNVKITIFLTSSGFEKIKKYFSIILNNN